MELRKTLRVFWIEGAQIARAVLTDVLRQEAQIEIVGYAESEADALNELRLREWNVAIVDIELRQGNGLGILAGLKNDSREYGKRLVFTAIPAPY